MRYDLEPGTHIVRARQCHFVPVTKYRTGSLTEKGRGKPMSQTVTKTLQATLAPPTAHKERKLRDTLSTYRKALQDAFDTGCETQNAVNEIVTPYELTSYAKDALKNYVPGLVDDADEIEDEPARSQLEDAEEDWLTVESADDETVEWASKRLGRNEPRGGTALLALASDVDGAVVVTDDEPLRNACKAVGVPLSGSLGVVVASVEKGTLEADEAKRLLVSMDEVGARLSARLLRKAESLIDEADVS